MDARQRKKIVVRGIVQGVGFRPFVYRLAVGENLKGFVSNSSQGVDIEVEGESDALDRFLQRLQTEPPVLAKITHVNAIEIPRAGDVEFVIRMSREDEERSTLISPDMCVCDDCLRELFDPEDRRYGYPFINCTNCGPRYTIIEDIPYDRPKTTMSDFTMCPECRAEYEDPLNRRFHAQPNACPVCGPRVWLTDGEGKMVEVEDPILETARRLKEGKIVAVKGLGGFHLACDATNDEAVIRLRERKHREEKPLAVMAPDLSRVERFAEVSSQESDLLLSPRRPIVLLKKKASHPLAESVAPRNVYVGTMLPYTPLHYLLLKEGFIALVMTSGNISEEPIAIGNEEALRRLGGIADGFLTHNRDIYLRSDDSVARIVSGLPRLVRRSRGYVPVPVFLRKSIPSVLAVGGELKNTICLTKEDRAFLSQHVGDLENVETLHFFEECAEHLSRILQIEPVAIAYDLHPDYLSTRWALEQEGIEHIGVQHHHAHIAACLAENGRDEKVIGLSLDGTGYGDDGRIWGGEILIADLRSYERAGHFEYRTMPGGALAIKEPWRMAVSYLHEIHRTETGGVEDFLNRWKGLPLLKSVNSEKIRVIVGMIRRGINVVQTSSLGRLFDGVAALVGLRDTVAFEGQAAMELEMAMRDGSWNGKDEGTGFEIREDGETILISPDRAVLQVVDDVLDGRAVGEISLRFHIGLVRLFFDVCDRIRRKTGMDTVALSGGCFQNRFLLEHLSRVLGEAGFDVISHSHVPTNDGGIALGQAVVASYRLS
ncbi:MAG: carbamoyltransferase HypF [bacterium]